MPVKISRTKAGTGGGGEGDGALRVPEHVDAEGHGDLGAQAADHEGHGRGRGGVDGEFVGPVVLVAEHDRVDTGRLQCGEVGSGSFEQAVQARGCIVKGRAGKGAEMDHGDHRLSVPENSPEIPHTVPAPEFVALLSLSALEQTANRIYSNPQGWMTRWGWDVTREAGAIWARSGSRVTARAGW